MTDTPTTTTTVITKPASDLSASLIRTVTPIIVGGAGTALIKLGVHIPSGIVTEIVQGALTAAYYAAVRLLEHFKSSKFGWLLGKAKAPVYPTGSMTVLGSK